MSLKRVAVVVFLAVDDNDEGVADLIATKMVRAALPPVLEWHSVEGLLVGVQELNAALSTGHVRMAPTSLFYDEGHLSTELPS